MVANIQALGAVPIAADAHEVVAVTLTIADMLSVGHSLTALVHSSKLPLETRLTYQRVGRQMVASARAEMARRIAEAADSAARMKR